MVRRRSQICMKPPKFKYRGFGLNIGSDIEFPELFSHDFEQEDVRVEAGPIEDRLFDDIAQGSHFQQIDPGVFKCQIPDTGRFLAKDGNLIRIERWSEADPVGFRMYTLTVAFSACLAQRNWLLLHASAVNLGRSVFLIAGSSGAGKSTMLSHLIQRGLRFFSDDVCVLDGRKDMHDRWLASSSYPILKLNEPSLIRFFPHSDHFKLWRDSEKYGARFHDQFEASALPIVGIAIIARDSNIHQIQVEQLEGIKAFEKLATCTYRPGFINSSLQQSTHARLVCGLAGDAPVYQLRRPDRQDDGDDLVKVLETLMYSANKNR